MGFSRHTRKAPLYGVVAAGAKIKRADDDKADSIESFNNGRFFNVRH